MTKSDMRAAIQATRNRPLTDDSVMPFGKWSGKLMRDVPCPYLDWFLTESQSGFWHDRIADYVNTWCERVMEGKDDPGILLHKPAPGTPSTVRSQERVAAPVTEKRRQD